MIRVDVRPRQDDLYDIYVVDGDDHLLNSSQGYANVEDAERIARRLFGQVGAWNHEDPIDLVVTHRDGRSFIERIR